MLLQHSAHLGSACLCKQLKPNPQKDLTTPLSACYSFSLGLTCLTKAQESEPSILVAHVVYKGMSCAPQEALQWLAEQPAVHWLSPRAPLSARNWQGTAISQSASAAPDAPVSRLEDHGSHPIWAAGLTGQGQIVGAGDSGIGSLKSAAAYAGCKPQL